LANFLYFLWKEENEVLAGFLVHLKLPLHHKILGRATHSSNKEKGKGKKQILIGQRVFGSAKSKL
jgi:hypothetical protein